MSSCNVAIMIIFMSFVGELREKRRYKSFVQNSKFLEIPFQRIEFSVCYVFS